MTIADGHLDNEVGARLETAQHLPIPRFILQNKPVFWCNHIRSKRSRATTIESAMVKGIDFATMLARRVDVVSGLC